MPKNIHTPRDELVCGKIDALEERMEGGRDVVASDLVRSIALDCERMEAKLVSRKDEVALLTKQLEAAMKGLEKLKRLLTGDTYLDAVSANIARQTINDINAMKD